MSNGKRAEFPKTNEEYFRFVGINFVIFGGAAFLLLLVVSAIFFPGANADNFGLYAGISLIVGLKATLIRAQWLKWRASKG